MSEISDEMLMAYADGALDEKARRLVDGYLASSPEARTRLQPFLVTGEMLAREFAPLLERPVPDALVATVLTAPMSKSPAAAGRPGLTARAPARPAEKTFFARLAELVAMPVPFGVMATACSAALAVLGLAALTQPGPATVGSPSSVVALTDTGLVAAGDLAAALETAPSQTKLSSGGSTITPVMTFRSAAGTFCRQYEMATSSGGDIAGLGCRRDDGRWIIRMQEALPQRTQQNSDYSRVAGGDNEPAIDATTEKMMSGPALDKNAERALLGNGWRNP